MRQTTAKELAVACIRRGCVLTWLALTATELKEVHSSLDHLYSACSDFPLSETVEPKLVLVYERLITRLTSSGEDPGDASLLPLRLRFATLFSTWARQEAGWLSSIGLGKTPNLSVK